jgi:hypothetical protein
MIRCPTGINGCEAAGIRQLVAESGLFDGNLSGWVGPEGNLRKF